MNSSNVATPPLLIVNIKSQSNRMKTHFSVEITNIFSDWVIISELPSTTFFRAEIFAGRRYLISLKDWALKHWDNGHGESHKMWAFKIKSTMLRMHCYCYFNFCMTVPKPCLAEICLTENVVDCQNNETYQSNRNSVRRQLFGWWVNKNLSLICWMDNYSQRFDMTM